MINDLLRHVDYIVQLVGIDYIALGPDFLERDLINWKPDHYARDLDDITKIPNVTEALSKHGYSNSDIHKILGKNILRVYRQVLKDS